MKPQRIYHPILFALYPTLYLFSANYTQTSFTLTLRSFGAALLFSVLMLCILRLFTRDWHRAAMITSLFFLLFFSFGHIETFIVSILTDLLIKSPDLPAAIFLPAANVFGFLVALFRVHLLVVPWAAILVLVSIKIMRAKLDVPKFTQVLNTVSLIVLLMPGSSILYAAGSDWALSSTAETKSAANASSVVSNSPADLTAEPDIYYIILDGYGQGNTLKDIDKFDNSAFLDHLKSRNFTVAESSHSNYGWTIQSISSSLNMNYLDELLPKGYRKNDDRPVVALIKNNQVVQFLHTKGYTTFAIKSGFIYTDDMNVDEMIGVDETFNPFESMLLSTTMATVLTSDIQVGQYQDNVIRRFTALSEVSKRPGPKFVFAHLMLAHSPWVFDRNGKILTGQTDRIADDRDIPPVEVQSKYSEQVSYENNLLLAAIDDILKNSRMDPIIIIQGDHGPGTYIDWDSFENNCLKERLSILNAYHLPEKKVEIDPDMTPVNTFRRIFRGYFQANLPDLENRSYFTDPLRSLNFVDVTERLDTCAALDK